MVYDRVRDGDKFSYEIFIFGFRRPRFYAKVAWILKVKNYLVNVNAAMEFMNTI